MTKEASEESPSTGSAELLAECTPWLWGGAFLFFGVGDVFTTFFGLRFPAIVEASPVGEWFVSTVGLWAIVPLKGALMAGFYGLWVAIPRPHNTGIPLGLCALGLFATLWNISLILFLLW